MKTERKKRVLVLCHGNKYRSPLCAAFLGKDRRLEVISAGFRKDAPRPAAKPVREYAALNGLDLSDHRSQRVTPQMLEWAEIIIYMDRGNERRLNDLIGLCPRGAVKAQLINLASYSYNRPVVPDPAFARNAGDFRAIMDLIKACSNEFLQVVDHLPLK